MSDPRDMEELWKRNSVVNTRVSQVLPPSISAVLLYREVRVGGGALKAAGGADCGCFKGALPEGFGDLILVHQ